MTTSLSSKTRQWPTLSWGQSSMLGRALPRCPWRLHWQEAAARSQSWNSFPHAPVWEAGVLPLPLWLSFEIHFPRSPNASFVIFNNPSVCICICQSFSTISSVLLSHIFEKYSTLTISCNNILLTFWNDLQNGFLFHSVLLHSWSHFQSSLQCSSIICTFAY